MGGPSGLPRMKPADWKYTKSFNPTMEYNERIATLYRDLEIVLGTDDSPVRRMDLPTAGAEYAGGPPYVATAPDFYRIACKWAEYLPRYYEQKPHMLNEMYSYSLAVARTGIDMGMQRHTATWAHQT